MKTPQPYNSHNAHMAIVRQQSMEQGARDGRFRQRSVQSKKTYNRAREKKGGRYDD